MYGSFILMGFYRVGDNIVYGRLCGVINID